MSTGVHRTLSGKNKSLRNELKWRKQQEHSNSQSKCFLCDHKHAHQRRFYAVWEFITFTWSYSNFNYDSPDFETGKWINECVPLLFVFFFFFFLHLFHNMQFNGWLFAVSYKEKKIPEMVVMNGLPHLQHHNPKWKSSFWKWKKKAF